MILKLGDVLGALGLQPSAAPAPRAWPSSTKIRITPVRIHCRHSAGKSFLIFSTIPGAFLSTSVRLHSTHPATRCPQGSPFFIRSPGHPHLPVVYLFARYVSRDECNNSILDLIIRRTSDLLCSNLCLPRPRHLPNLVARCGFVERTTRQEQRDANNNAQH